MMSILPQQQEESCLRYELRINDMILMPLEKQKQTLVACIAFILGIDASKLHKIIYTHIQKWMVQSNLPRKLNYLYKDQSILQDYKKYPELVGFIKITLEMVSQIYQTKITLFSLTNHGLLVGMIVNEHGYQQQIKVGRVHNVYYQIKDNLQTNQSSGKQQPSSSSQSYKLYQAFDIEPLSAKKFEHKQLESLLTKSFSQIPGGTGIKKNLSLCQDRTNIPFPSVQSPILKPIAIPNLNTNTQLNKQFDQISLQNVIDEQDLMNAQQLTQSMNFNKQDLTQSLTIQKGIVQPQVAQQIPAVTPPVVISTQQQPPLVSQQQINNTHQQQISGDSSNFYGFYSHHMFYPPYTMGQSSTRNENYNNYNNSGMATSVSLSPGKNIVRRQNSTLQINQNQRYTGRLKFFDEGKNYGFIIMDADQSDIFVHCDDLQKAGINKDRIRSYKQSEGMIRFSFKVMSYFGKYRESRKAVDLIILDDGLGMPALYT